MTTTTRCMAIASLSCISPLGSKDFRLLRTGTSPRVHHTTPALHTRPCRTLLHTIMAADGAHSQHSQRPKSVLQVLTYVPNLICYTRLALVVTAEASLARQQPQWALRLYLASLVLDGFDGAAARLLKQESTFGAFLDVAVDNITRAALWTRAFPGLQGALVPALESACFTVTFRAGGKAWKDGCFRDAPGWVQLVMARNFKTPAGALAVAGLMGLPLWCWATRVLPGHPLCVPWLGAVLVVGRAVAAAVEVWLLRRALLDMVKADMAASSDGRANGNTKDS